jgi:two-component system heavy metal sensor histidine kinase CusS
MSSVINRQFAIFRTIRARLTLWGAALAMLLCVMLCVILYFGLRLSLLREVDGFLEGEVSEFRSILLEEDEEDDLPEVEREMRRELGSRLRRDLTFRLLDQAGRVVMSSDPDDPLPAQWSVSEMGLAEVGGTRRETVHAPRHPTSFRVCSQWVTLRGDRACIAQAAYLLSGVEHSLSVFRRVCLGALLIAPALALAAGFLFARRSLRPVDTITQTARRIDAGHFSQRIARSGNGDELDRLAETLNDMLDRIESHVRRMQQFTADASHELRTPLAALRGTTEVILSQPRSSEELRAVLEENMDQYARLGRIADDLLLLARADVGQLSLKFERVNLNRIAADVVDLYSPLAQERSIELKAVAAEEVELRADGARLHQLLGNIIDNAVKYAGKGCHVRVSLSTRNGSAIVVIADNGPGIAPHDLPHVFDRFYRADHAHRGPDTSGAGLGLPICQTIVRLHDGAISLENAPEGGLRVSISLPLARADAD